MHAGAAKSKKGFSIMSDVKDLYRNAIVDHFKMPHNYRKIDGANRRADGHNSLCGDKFTIYIHLEEDVIGEIGFIGNGCAIATASASMMTENVQGKTETEAREAFTRFTELLTGNIDAVSLNSNISDS